MASTTAFLFPGQGSQHVGMGRDLYDAFPAAQAVFEAADDALGFALTKLMFGAGGDAEAEAERLTQTQNTQPALYVHSLAAMAVLRDQGHEPTMAAGHSLGEYSALAAADALGFEEGLGVVRLRGQLMAEAGTQRPGTMAAVLGLDDDAVVEACWEASSMADGIVQAANFNAPGQVVVSGDEHAIEHLVAVAKEHGAKRVIPLPVSGAFHSPLMAHAHDGLADALASVEIRPPRCPVYLNVTAEPTTDPDTIRHHLLEQLLSPVRWSQTLRRMQSDGAARFVEVGAGTVLSGLAKRTLGRDTETVAAGTAEEVRAFGT